MAEFGEQLKKAREAKGMTQQTLADQLYVTRQTISRWESGSRYPDLLTTKKLSQVLEVNVGVLLSEEEPQTIVEKTPVVEDPITNRIIIALYACVAMAYTASLVNVLLQLPKLAEVSAVRDIYLLVFLACFKMIPAAFFGAGLLWALKGSLCPKKTGLVAAAFFIGSAGADFSMVFSEGTIGNLLTIGICSMMYLLGAAAAVAVFVRKKRSSLPWFALYAVIAFGMFRTLLRLSTMMLYAAAYLSAENALHTVMEICIFALFLYQMQALKRKRIIAAELE